MFKKNDWTDINVVTPVKIPSTRKFSASFGINDYPGTGNDLQGCVNDAIFWQTLLRDTYGFQTRIFKNSECKHCVFMEVVGNLILDSKPNDHIAITYSGHGTNVLDQNKDEADGRDEALCLYDELLIDDAIRELFKKLNPEAKLTFISDSCHSGTVTRTFLRNLREKKENQIVPRYLPPYDEVAENISPKKIRSRVDDKNKIFYPEEGMKEILISGCLPTEYSYDARIGGSYNGAMTYNAVDILRQQPEITYENFHKKLRLRLPSGRYPQTPCLEGSESNKKTLMFA